MASSSALTPRARSVASIIRNMMTANDKLAKEEALHEATPLEDTNQRHREAMLVHTTRLTPPNSGPPLFPLIHIIILEDHGLVERLDPASAFQAPSSCKFMMMANNRLTEINTVNEPMLRESIVKHLGGG
jgi:hypothetical protein